MLGWPASRMDVTGHEFTKKLSLKLMLFSVVLSSELPVLRSYFLIFKIFLAPDLFWCSLKLSHPRAAQYDQRVFGVVMLFAHFSCPDFPSRELNQEPLVITSLWALLPPPHVSGDNGENVTLHLVTVTQSKHRNMMVVLVERNSGEPATGSRAAKAHRCT